MPDSRQNSPPRLLLFGKITPENAAATIRRLARIWYGVAALFTIISLAMLRHHPTSLTLPAGLAGSAYFLESRKSRAIAAAQLALCLFLTAFIAPHGRAPTVGQAVDFLVVALLILTAGRGLQATWIHQKGAKVNWKRVTAISAVMIPMGFLMLAAVGMAQELIIDDLTMFAIMALEFVSFALTMGFLTWKYPFAQRDQAEAVAKIFE